MNAVLAIEIGNRLPSVSLLNSGFLARKSRAKFPFVGDFLSSLPTAFAKPLACLRRSGNGLLLLTFTSTNCLS